MNKIKTISEAEAVHAAVREGYGKIAGSGGSCCGPAPTCCGSAPAASEELAKHIGYSSEELEALPEGANMGLSCGNPNALASLQPGEVVLDLGSGGGFDVFIAGRKVGPTGRAIGVDMTSEMLAKARKNTESYRQTSGLDNVEFRLGEIEHLPVADATVDAIISNCVINLSPDKPQVWREIARVLKPGGRVAVSDLALLKPLPPAILESVAALVGCVAGAVLVSDTERMAKEAGLTDIVPNPKSSYIDGMVDWQDPLYQKIIANLPTVAKPSDYITSLEITARKQSLNLGSNVVPRHGGSCGQTVEKQKTSQNNRKKQMKTAAAIGIIAAALGFTGVAAENSQTPPSKSAPAAATAADTGASALRGAAAAKQYLFAFIYEQNDEATRAARKTFDGALKKMTPAPKSVAVDRSDPTEKEMVEQFKLEAAPMPLVLAIAPNGAVTAGIKGADLTEARLLDAVASPGMQQCLKALQERKLIFICLQNASTKANDAAMKGVNDLKADPQFTDGVEVVKVDPTDAKEAKLLAQLKADPKAKTASTTLLAPPGMIVAQVDGATSKSALEASLKKAMSACSGASGCCSPQK
jgi:SAM-dependent methyltransferase